MTQSLRPARSGVTTPGILVLFRAQLVEKKLCQAPTLSSNASDIEEQRLPGFKLKIEVRKAD